MINISFYNKYKKYKNKYLQEKMNQSGGIIKISIQNPQNTPWLDWIETGVKKYEGRLNKGIFAKLHVGDIVIWYDRISGKEVKTEITELRYYVTFTDAFNKLGKNLVPIPNITPELVEKLYAQYFTKEDIEKYGVLTIGVKPL